MVSWDPKFRVGAAEGSGERDAGVEGSGRTIGAGGAELRAI